MKKNVKQALKILLELLFQGIFLGLMFLGFVLVFAQYVKAVKYFEKSDLLNKYFVAFLSISIPIIILVYFLYSLLLGYFYNKIVKSGIEPLKISIKKTFGYFVSFILAGIIINLLILLFHLPTVGGIILLYLLLSLVLFFLLLILYNKTFSID